MVTTPRLALERGNDAGLSELGRSLCPEKSEETLPPAKEPTKLVDREARKEEGDDVVWARIEPGAREGAGSAIVRAWSAKLEAVVATSIASGRR